VHQVFQNADGWLVAAPFEYTGETVTSADIAVSQQVADADIPGVYQLLTHKYGLNHQEKELAKPVEVQLNADGTISGARSGRWTTEPGTSYVTLNISGTEYKGVMVRQTMEPTTDQVAAFTAMSKAGVSVWGYCKSPTNAAIYSPFTTSGAADGDGSGTQLYDLQGRHVASPAKGLYILRPNHQGKTTKKILVK
jgi:arabinan endo-1,5-alpha-L-arabinosidase